MEMQATANGCNPYFEGQYPAEDAEDTANRLALVAERDALAAENERLRESLSDVLTTREVEAKASMTRENATANFSSSRRESAARLKSARRSVNRRKARTRTTRRTGGL